MGGCAWTELGGEEHWIRVGSEIEGGRNEADGVFGCGEGVLHMFSKTFQWMLLRNNVAAYHALNEGKSNKSRMPCEKPLMDPAPERE